LTERRAGLLVTLEGVEGAGKSTLSAGVGSRLRAEGFDVVHCREPGGTSLGESVRATVLDPSHGDVSPWAELFLMLAARAQLTQEIIEPALAQGRIVICDRFLDASTAYQGGGRELGLDRVDALNQLATGGRRPDLTLLLDLDPRLGRSRQGHPPDRMEREDEDFHRRVRRAYLELARREPHRFFVLDARCAAAELQEQAWAALQPRLPGTPHRSS
jgi:dTMP kinase